MHAAAEFVKKEISIRQAKKQFQISRNCLKRCTNTKASGAKHLRGNETVREKQTVFCVELETDLATYVKYLAKRFHFPTSVKYRKLAYEPALQIKISLPQLRTINTLGEKTG